MAISQNNTNRLHGAPRKSWEHFLMKSGSWPLAIGFWQKQNQRQNLTADHADQSGSTLDRATIVEETMSGCSSC
jgi:hypothetical protein